MENETPDTAGSSRGSNVFLAPPYLKMQLEKSSVVVGGDFSRPTPAMMIGKTAGWTKDQLDVWDAGLRQVPGPIPGSKRKSTQKEG